ncbi:Ribosome biogenesis protein SSF2 [Komagataella phaffii CBS 7435]|uniref:Protein required for ribosomal large subunit maturation, functionally redundant with Ssf1p n=2 Tax=Komagataella phaffii TaxID=460519 RepID=C4QWP4_KOMPG|nr:Protein required for ribosomal large subunit maturation, functionally redundant with Ssf1p [Komagataella phaffii GS115]AOA61561.1 GQ67_02875T0 [Komagataella phaffii]CAH2446416.1 Ribosome biogenesis protein SSF2 [Komagataella phaffii CBS 7435]AOA66381.1 GQ68_02372T0 [Komagataella phaffii GS115]CAY67667.1 Protein required for ribosomal large subunit maturation, functionally redundant with Ssf1p [Komagataella phaffii GS115]CCA36759.1 Ribosome biogenesis protein SSF2 [Komagataella phaffii CBS 7
MANKAAPLKKDQQPVEEEDVNVPKSMIIRVGSSFHNPSLQQLSLDLRVLMQPHTAINLRERRKNCLKDYVVMCGPLGVTQLMTLSQNEKTANCHLRLASMSKGPTTTYRIKEYSLVKDIVKTLKHPKMVGKSSTIFQRPPLLVMNGFANPKVAEPHEKVMITQFQNMFPPIMPEKINVDSIRRVLMINKDKETGEINLRHYAIDTKVVDVNKNLKKILNAKIKKNKKMPNLGNIKDISEILEDSHHLGYTSESEVEDEESLVQVDETESLTKAKVIKNEGGANNIRKKAIKLVELGPRLRMELVKIEAGVCDGEVLYHRYVKKSDSEIIQQKKRLSQKESEKAKRRKIQKENVDKKLAKKQERRKRQKEKYEANGSAVPENDNSADESDEEVDLRPEDYENDSDLYSE